MKSEGDGFKTVNKIVLMQITGRGLAAYTGEVLNVLARFDANVLDIGQSLIHETLNLGLLVEVNEADHFDLLKENLEEIIHLHGGVITFTDVSKENYKHWVSAHSRQRYIVTLLSRRITAEQLARVVSIVNEEGLEIFNINRLSGRIDLSREESIHSIESRTKASVELLVRGKAKNIERLRERFLEAANELGIDISFQKDNAFRRNRRLVVFDMDSTLIEAEVIDELAKYAEVGEEVARITEQAMAGEMEFQESFRKRVALLKGLDESVLAEVAENLPLTEGAEHLILALKALGYKTAIISGGFKYFGLHLQNKLDIDYVYANELEIVDGKVTGNVVGAIVDGQRKAELLKQIVQKEKIDLEQVIAVGDGANDLGMLALSGLGIAFRAKPLVKENAKHAISTLGLDGILYLLGVTDWDLLGLKKA